MARRKAKSFNTRSLALFGAVAATLAGGGYLAGKNGVPLPQKLAALVDKTAQLTKPAVETVKAEVKFAESPTVKQADKSELTHLLKTGDTKEDARSVRTAKMAAVKSARAAAKTESAKAENSKADSAKADSAKADSIKVDSAKADSTKADPAVKKADAGAAASAKSEKAASKAGKTQAAKLDADAPMPAADIPSVIEAAQPSPAAEPVAIDATGGPLRVALLGTGIPTSEDNKLRLSVGFANHAGRPIRAFEGVLKFTDRQDKYLFSSKISVSALISQGATIKWDERVDPDKLDARGKKLIGADKDDLRAVFQVKKVFFVDGSVQQFGARG